MKSLSQIRSELSEIANSYNLVGPSVEALVSILTKSIYDNELCTTNYLLEDSASRCRSINSAITHAMDLGHSVFRGKNQRISFSSLEYTGSTSVKYNHLDTLAKFGGYTLAFNGDQSFEPNESSDFNRRYNVDCIVTPGVLTYNYTVTNLDKFMIYIPISDISNDVSIFVNGVRIPHQEGLYYKADYNDKLDNFKLCVLTMSGYGIVIVNRDVGTANSFREGDVITVKYVTYLPTNIDVSTLKTIPNFSYGSRIQYNITNYEPRIATIGEVYFNSLVDFRNSYTIKANNDFKNTILSYFVNTSNSTGESNKLLKGVNTVKSYVTDKFFSLQVPKLDTISSHYSMLDGVMYDSSNDEIKSVDLSYTLLTLGDLYEVDRDETTGRINSVTYTDYPDYFNISYTDDNGKHVASFTNDEFYISDLGYTGRLVKSYDYLDSSRYLSKVKVVLDQGYTEESVTEPIKLPSGVYIIDCKANTFTGENGALVTNDVKVKLIVNYPEFNNIPEYDPSTLYKYGDKCLYIVESNGDILVNDVYIYINNTQSSGNSPSSSPSYWRYLYPGPSSYDIELDNCTSINKVIGNFASLSLTDIPSYSSSTKYKYGDKCIYVGPNGTFNYMYIYPEPKDGTLPTDQTYWILINEPLDKITYYSIDDTIRDGSINYSSNISNTGDFELTIPLSEINKYKLIGTLDYSSCKLHTETQYENVYKKTGLKLVDGSIEVSYVNREQPYVVTLDYPTKCYDITKPNEVKEVTGDWSGNDISIFDVSIGRFVSQDSMAELNLRRELNNSIILVRCSKLVDGPVDIDGTPVSSLSNYTFLGKYKSIVDGVEVEHDYEISSNNTLNIEVYYTLVNSEFELTQSMIEDFRQKMDEVYYISNAYFSFNEADPIGNPYQLNLHIYYNKNYNSNILKRYVNDLLDNYRSAIGQVFDVYELVSKIQSIEGISYVTIDNLDGQSTKIELRSNEYMVFNVTTENNDNKGIIYEAINS